MRRTLLALFTIASLAVYAQRNCGSQNYLDYLRVTDPASYYSVRSTENTLNTGSAQRNFSTEHAQSEKLIRIPVVVHVLYNSTAGNISDEQILSQIEALNRDFRRNNADSANTPLAFRYISADAEIEFALATSDPWGGPTTGIVRKYTNVSSWSNDDKIKFSSQGGDDAWDSRSYLNIWVGDLRRLLGYSSAPGVAPERDGIVINTSAFGTINVSAPYDKGRTAVHEVGHWLGLKHIWGDSYCGDDGVEDTPRQGNFTTGCPSGFRTSCNNGSNGDMYMNYMDFTNDACINLFTHGQAERMRLNFEQGGARNSLLSSKGLNQPWTTGRPPAEPLIATSVKLFPNPASAFIRISTNDNSLTGLGVNILNTNGISVLQSKISGAEHLVRIASLPAGQYFVVIGEGKGKLVRSIIKN